MDLAGKIAASKVAKARRRAGLSGLEAGPLAPLLQGREIVDAGRLEADMRADAVIARYLLEDDRDYRGALQRWFEAVRPGGLLVVVVPHAFLHARRLESPSPWDAAERRLYTPASLMLEVEEALPPNSYRVRHLCDDDRGYDYTALPDEEPDVGSDVLLAIEKIDRPGWTLERPRVEVVATEPDYAFEPVRTRVEVARTFNVRRILILKLDHMGDFLLSLGALERARATFPEAEITLVVGSWNLQAARELGLADIVLTFDAFPRNSSEEEVDVAGKAALFQSRFIEDYDLAIDLRVDKDTRFLLRSVRAPLRAGLGTAAEFPFLDIFLPLDFNRNRPETAREYLFGHDRFVSQGPVERRAHRLIHRKDDVERSWAIIWGPYERLRPGNYLFEPEIEWGEAASGMLMLDIGLNAERVAFRLVPPADERIRIPFQVVEPDSEFEFRVFVVENQASIDFSFYGGRLIREGAGSTLHQSEYGALLIELIALRIGRTGILQEA
jgi:hypothetical protein